MLAWLKRTGVELAVGAALGFVIWSLLGKGLTSMLFTSLGGTFSCQADVASALDRFLAMQLYSALGGAVLVLLVRALLRHRAGKRAAALPAAPTP
jgi:hypothetical protein